MNERTKVIETQEKLALSVSEVAEALGICRPAAYELVHQPGFPAVRVSDHRLIVPVDALRRWLDAQAGDNVG